MDKVQKYFRTYHLPWSESVADDDIIRQSPFTENDEVVVTIKMDGECLHPRTPIKLFNKMEKSISSIKVGDIVIGYSGNEIVPTKVLKTFKNGNTKEWVKIEYQDFSRGKTKIINCTKNHKFFVHGEYKEASTLKVGDSLTHYRNVLICSDIQKQILLGKLLGDGSFCGNSIVQYTHKLEHKEYSDYINSCLTDVYSKSCFDNNENSYSKKQKYKSWTKSSFTIKELHSIMIVNGKKVFPKILIDEVTPLTLAVLYMDDGSINYSNKLPRMQISTCGFDDESCENIRKSFEKFNIKTTLTNSNGYNYINISAYSVNDFCELVKQFIPNVMQYKLPIEHRVEIVSPIINHTQLLYNIIENVKITNITINKNDAYAGKYDFETETHNYFANGVLVHNCTSLYPSGRCHARSIDSANHPSRNYVKAYWRERAHLLPHGWRVCGENLYAKHSIHYTDLKAYLYVFSIWTEHNTCLSWEETKEWCELLDLVHVPVIYEGKYDENAIKSAFKPHKDTHEGYVIRSVNTFHYDDANKNIAKYVRKNHVQSDEHWMFQEIIPNILEK